MKIKLATECQKKTTIFLNHLQYLILSWMPLIKCCLHRQDTVSGEASPAFGPGDANI